MGTPVNSRQPCLDQENCGSSDAMTVYAEGYAKCYSCERTFKMDVSKDDQRPSSNGKVYEITHEQEVTENFRGVSPETSAKFGVLDVEFSVNGNTLTAGDAAISFRKYPGPGGKGYQLRRTTEPVKPADKFIKVDMAPGLIGVDQFISDSKYASFRKAVTITEGYEDAMAVYEMMGDFPVFSVQSAATAVKDCKVHYDLLSEYETIVICFDNDKAGKAARDSVAALFDYAKVKFVDCAPLKDAGEWLIETGGAKRFKNLWFDAKHFAPDGIISGESELLELAIKPIAVSDVLYPWESLNELTYGMRTGETVLITAQEGIGKTEVMRHLEHHILTNYPEEKVGTMHLEENVTRQLKGLATLQMGVPCHLPDSGVGDDTIQKALQPLLKGQRLHVYQHFGSNSLDTIINRIKFLARVCGCRWIFLDHISIIVSGNDEDQDERKALDRLSTKFASLVEELDIGLIFVSHVNDEGKTRGSRNISKVADIRIDLHRDADSEDAVEANTTRLYVSKNRFSGARGWTKPLLFDRETYTFREMEHTQPSADDKKKSVDRPPFD